MRLARAGESAAIPRPNCRSTTLGVLGGALLSEWLNPRALRWVAGVGFIAVGVWVLATGAD